MDFFTKKIVSIQRKLYKLLLILRIILILMISVVMQLSANTYAQQISLHQNNISIRQIFKVIKYQTGYDVLWQPDKLDASKTINAQFNATPLSDVLKQCLVGQSIAFEIQDKSIVLKIISNSKKVMSSWQDSLIYKGKVRDENGKVMTGATVKISGSSKTTFTTEQGNFAIYAPLKGTLEISYIGYLTKRLTLNGLRSTDVIVVTLIPGTNNLGEVNVVSTGYQDIPKERATGSFEVITKEQLQHSSNSNLLRRLEGITTSMNFNNQITPINSANSKLIGLAGQFSSSPATNLTIRGRNTLVPSANVTNTTGQVLVVIDGIASPYSIDKVDPNDVESITVLKDAASASIWGSRAANGVIVVKTKRGSYNRPLQVSFNSDFNLTQKLNLFYKKYLSTSEYIDAQIFQFNASRTSIDPPNLTQFQNASSPVAEILNQQNKGQITSLQANTQIDGLRGNDVRRDYNKYILRDAFSQNYSLALDAGTKTMTYRLSGAYNNTLNNTIGSSSNRLSLNYSTSIHPLKNLDIQANVTYSEINTNDQNQSNPVTASVSSPYYLYTRLVDDNGNSLNIPYIYRPSFVDLISSTYGNNVLDLHFNPLDDMKEGYLKTDQKNLNLNLGSSYKVNSIFSVNVIYNYSKGYNEQNSLNRQNSFYMRDLITRFTTPPNYVDPQLGPLPFFRQIPLGGMYSPIVVKTTNQTLRGILSANKNWADKHSFNAIVGTDLTESYSLTKSDQYYGYDENTLVTSPQLNYSSFLTPLFLDSFGTGRAQIPYSNSFTDYKVRTYSLFANAAYTYNKLYTLSTSIRKDVSSQFGPGTNRRGTPFYSLGGKWNIAGEEFYELSFLPRLQLRTTFGYNGNVNSAVSSRPTITYSLGNALNGLPYATLPPFVASNSELRPEKTAVVNIGLDFGFRNNRVSGSLEYYDKRTTDLLAINPVDPTTGYSRLNLNSATLHGWGTDFTINSQNLQSGLFGWTSNFLFSYNRVKVIKVFSTTTNTAGTVVTSPSSLNVGYDLSRLFAFNWAGLDPLTGDPRGYLNGQIVTISNTAAGNTAFASIFNGPQSNARYFGSALPLYYGSLRNTFSYGSLSISANLMYKLGYYFRRPSSDVVNYTQFFNSNTLLGAEYSNRWQKLGDEKYTNVPSMTYPGTTNRDNFYYYSEINVLKGDHIRLQEINLSYSLNKKDWFIKNPRIYANITNLGVIWRANRLGIDPDINDYPNPRTYTFGFSANF